MLDLGTSFIASVARDPNAIAIVDADQRLTYQQWYARISAVVAAFSPLKSTTTHDSGQFNRKGMTQETPLPPPLGLTTSV